MKGKPSQIHYNSYEGVVCKLCECETIIIIVKGIIIMNDSYDHNRNRMSYSLKLCTIRMRNGVIHSTQAHMGAYILLSYMSEVLKKWVLGGASQLQCEVR